MAQERLDSDIVWDGVTQVRTLTDEADRTRHALADAAKSGDWQGVFELLSEHREWINSTRPGGSAWYAPLHQAAWHGAPVTVVQQLLDSGAWRTHQNARGERPVDVERARLLGSKPRQTLRSRLGHVWRGLSLGRWRK